MSDGWSFMKTCVRIKSLSLLLDCVFGDRLLVFCVLSLCSIKLTPEPTGTKAFLLILEEFDSYEEKHDLKQFIISLSFI